MPSSTSVQRDDREVAQRMRAIALERQAQTIVQPVNRLASCASRTGEQLLDVAHAGERDDEHRDEHEQRLARQDALGDTRLARLHLRPRGGVTVDDALAAGELDVARAVAAAEREQHR